MCGKWGVLRSALLLLFSNGAAPLLQQICGKWKSVVAAG